GSFGRDVTDHHAVGGTGEASICDKPDRIAETRADDGRRWPKHLAHAGTAFRAFVSDDYHIARTDAAIEYDFHAIFLTIKDAGGACDFRIFDACDFCHGPFFGKIASQDCQMTLTVNRVVPRVNHVLVGARHVWHVCERFGNRLTCDGERIPVELSID